MSKSLWQLGHSINFNVLTKPIPDVLRNRENLEGVPEWSGSYVLRVSKQEMCLHYDLLFFLWGMIPTLLKSKFNNCTLLERKAVAQMTNLISG